MNSFITKVTLSFLLVAGHLSAQSFEVSLWPGPAPGSEDWNYLESETLQPPDSTRRISNVARAPRSLFFSPRLRSPMGPRSSFVPEAAFAGSRSIMKARFSFVG